MACLHSFRKQWNKCKSWEKRWLQLRNRLPHHSCSLNSSLTCLCFPRNWDLIRLGFVFFLKTTPVCSPLFQFYLHKQPRNTQIMGWNVDLHNNQHTEKKVSYCALAGLAKNQVQILNYRGSRKCTEKLQNDPCRSWNSWIFKYRQSIPELCLPRAMQSSKDVSVISSRGNAMKRHFLFQALCKPI